MNSSIPTRSDTIPDPQLPTMPAEEVLWSDIEFRVYPPHFNVISQWGKISQPPHSDLSELEEMLAYRECMLESEAEDASDSRTSEGELWGMIDYINHLNAVLIRISIVCALCLPFPAAAFMDYLCFVFRGDSLINPVAALLISFAGASVYLLILAAIANVWNYKRISVKKQKQLLEGSS